MRVHANHHSDLCMHTMLDVQNTGLSSWQQVGVSLLGRLGLAGLLGCPSVRQNRILGGCFSQHSVIVSLVHGSLPLGRPLRVQYSPAAMQVRVRAQRVCITTLAPWHALSMARWPYKGFSESLTLLCPQRYRRNFSGSTFRVSFHVRNRILGGCFVQYSIIASLAYGELPISVQGLFIYHSCSSCIANCHGATFRSRIIIS